MSATDHDHQAKMLAFVSAEIGNKKAEVEQLKKGVGQATRLLQDIEAKLDALRALRASYKPKPKTSRAGWRKKRAERLQNAAASDHVAKTDTPPAAVAPPAPSLPGNGAGGDSKQVKQNLKAFAAERVTSRPADKEQIAHWAAPRGIVFNDWSDLPRVNEQRIKNGDLPFSRRTHHASAGT